MVVVAGGLSASLLGSKLSACGPPAPPPTISTSLSLSLCPSSVVPPLPTAPVHRLYCPSPSAGCKLRLAGIRATREKEKEKKEKSNCMDYQEEIRTAVIQRGAYSLYAGTGNPEEPPTLDCRSSLSLEDDLRSAFGALPLDRSRTPTLFLDSAVGSQSSREIVAQVMFEELDVPYLAICNTSSLAMFGLGETSAVVIDVGHTGTSVVPVLQGEVVHHAAQFSSVGGALMRQKIRDALAALSSDYAGMEDVTVDQILHHHCFALEDPERFHKKPYQTTQHPYGRLVYEVPEELLFRTQATPQQPDLFSLPDMVMASIGGLLGTPDEVHMVSSKIVLCGGGSALPGLANRLRYELQRSAKSGTQFSSVAPADYLSNFDLAHSAFIGASILTSMDHFREIGVNKAQYDEEGPSCVRRMTF